MTSFTATEAYGKLYRLINEPAESIQSIVIMSKWNRVVLESDEDVSAMHGLPVL